MAPNTQPAKDGEIAELLRKLIIVQLGLAGVPQRHIRRIVGGGIGEINAIAKLLPKRALAGRTDA